MFMNFHVIARDPQAMSSSSLKKKKMQKQKKVADWVFQQH